MKVSNRSGEAGCALDWDAGGGNADRADRTDRAGRADRADRADRDEVRD